MSRSTKPSAFVIICSLLLLLGQTLALLSVPPQQRQHSSVSHASRSSPLHLYPGEGEKLVDAFNKAVIEDNPEGDLVVNTTPTSAEAVQQQVNGIAHRIRHALDTITPTLPKKDQKLRP